MYSAPTHGVLTVGGFVFPFFSLLFPFFFFFPPSFPLSSVIEVIHSREWNLNRAVFSCGELSAGGIRSPPLFFFLFFSSPLGKRGTMIGKKRKVRYTCLVLLPPSFSSLPFPFLPLSFSFPFFFFFFPLFSLPRSGRIEAKGCKNPNVTRELAC